MTAVLIPTGSEADWLEARRQGVTASEIAVIMGLSPYSSPYALYHQKLGNLPGLEDSLVLRVGRHNESLACELFAEHHPEFWVEGDGQTLYSHPDRTWQLATPDRHLYEVIAEDGAWRGYSHQPVAVLEAKTAASYDGWGDDGTDDIPVHYRCQVLWQCDVMGVSSWYLACLFLHTRQLRVYEGVIDEAAQRDLKLMRTEAELFLNRLQDRREPDVDWRPATVDALKALHPSVTDEGIFVSPQLAMRYRAAVRNHKHWEQRKKLYEAQLRERMGSARRAHIRSDSIPSGEVIARRDVFEQREHVRSATTVDKLVPVYPKETS